MTRKWKMTASAYALWAMLGLVGAHRFYLREPAGGVFYLALAILSVTVHGAIALVLMGVWMYDGFTLYERIQRRFPETIVI